MSRSEPTLDSQSLKSALAPLSGWKPVAGDPLDTIQKTWQFKDFHQTMAFVNAVAQVAHAMDHHPDLHVGYNRCLVSYTTHDAGGVTQRDIEAASRVEALAEGRVHA